MQRALLPHEEPDVDGLEVGHVYASSAHVDVGGDLYDFLALEDGRLAVVLGDVTGHGVEAAADMAMTKFVFRSLARENPEPGEFLAAANAVVCDEIAPGKFVTMLYMTVDPGTGAVACASGGHPLPRILLPDGSVRVLQARGLALGIEPDQHYRRRARSCRPAPASSSTRTGSWRRAAGASSTARSGSTPRSPPGAGSARGSWRMPSSTTAARSAAASSPTTAPSS